MSVIDLEYSGNPPHIKVSIDGVEHTEIDYIMDWNCDDNYGKLEKPSKFHWRLRIPEDKFQIDHGTLTFSKIEKEVLFIDENFGM